MQIPQLLWDGIHQAVVQSDGIHLVLVAKEQALCGSLSSGTRPSIASHSNIHLHPSPSQMIDRCLNGSNAQPFCMLQGLPPVCLRSEYTTGFQIFRDQTFWRETQFDWRVEQ